MEKTYLEDVFRKSLLEHHDKLNRGRVHPECPEERHGGGEMEGGA